MFILVCVVVVFVLFVHWLLVMSSQFGLRWPFVMLLQVGLLCSLVMLLLAVRFDCAVVQVAVWLVYCCACVGHWSCYCRFGLRWSLVTLWYFGVDVACLGLLVVWGLLEVAFAP